MRAANEMSMEQFRALEKRTSKYGNQRHEIPGYGMFDSYRESKRYFELRADPNVRGLRRQVRYLLIPKTTRNRATIYFADHDYWRWDKEAQLWRHVVEDSKGIKTPVYRLKWKLMYQVYKIEVLES